MNRKVYPWLLVGLLSFNFGVVYFDRNALNFLMPLIQPELHLSNEQVGMLGSALSLSWALAGLLIGRLSDVLGRRKLILVIAAFIFSVASMLSGWVTSFAMLLLTRLLMGFAEGGVMPISQALISAEIYPARASSRRRRPACCSGECRLLVTARVPFNPKTGFNLAEAWSQLSQRSFGP